jgi:hypothetical protein
MHFETMLQGPALARAGEVQDALEELAEMHGVSVSQLRIVDYMRILKSIIYQDVALDALREMLPRIRLPDGTTNGNILEYWRLTLALAQDLTFLVGAIDEMLLSSLKSAVMPLDIYKGQWSKISKIKQSSKLFLQIERDLVHLNLMPSHVQDFSPPKPDAVVTPAVDVGTSTVRTNPAAHLVDAATPTVRQKDDAPYQYSKYKTGDTSGNPRKCFAC